MRGKEDQRKIKVLIVVVLFHDILEMFQKNFIVVQARHMSYVLYTTNILVV
jgi:hypothetical protein